MNEEIKRGRGRPKGSTAPNTLDIPAEDLVSLIREKRITTVKVARTWFSDLDKAVESSNMDEKIEFKIS